MKAVIMAGGKGTRLHPLTKDELPKSLYPICGKPILLHQIESLKKNGIRDCILIIGHLGEKVEAYLKDGAQFGLNVEYVHEQTPLGTGGALYYLKETLQEDFLFLYGDIIFDIDIDRMEASHRQNHAELTLLAHPNSHPYDSDIVLKDWKGLVSGFDHKGSPRPYFYDNCVNAGLYIVSPEFLQRIDAPQKINFEHDLIEPACRNGRIYAYCSPEYVVDAGTPERIKKIEWEIRSGLPDARSLRKPQKCIFLDRDGTLNQYVGLIWSPEQLILEEQAIEAIQMINRSSYLAILITNQPAVAKGKCTEESIHSIHRKLATELGNSGCYLDDMFFCPHHPEKGFPDENPLYKIKCNCRKPLTGMIDLAREKYHVDCTQSWFIGDTTTDVQTGINAGCSTVLLKTGEGGRDGKYRVKPDLIAENVYDAVRDILGM